jgi:hypothetical protein
VPPQLDAIFGVAREHSPVVHVHTLPAAVSDVDEVGFLVDTYAGDVDVHLVTGNWPGECSRRISRISTAPAPHDGHGMTEQQRRPTAVDALHSDGKTRDDRRGVIRCLNYTNWKSRA